MSAETLPMKLSQDSLFFPLPFTNAAIDNVVQVKNPLPVVQGDPKANVVSFKILSEVQHRYSVRPPVGFIGAGEHITIVFSFNPEQVKAAKNPAERELPTEATKDAIHIDFAVVDSVAVADALAHWNPADKEAKNSKDVMADASQFWKKRGQVTKNSPTTVRVKLRCVFAARNNVPESLVMRMKEEEGKAKKGAAEAEAPKTRPPQTSTTHPANKAPPEAPPRRHSDSAHPTPRESTPRENAGANAPPPAAGTAATASVASRIVPPAAPSVPVSKPGAHGKLSAGAGASATSEKKKSLVSRVLNFRLSYALVAVLLVLTFFCGLWDRGNVLTWMLSKPL